MTNTSMKDLGAADPARFMEIQRQADFHLSQLWIQPNTLAIEVLCYIISVFFLNVKTVPGVTKLEAFDLYMASTRKTLEIGLEQPDQVSN